MTWNVRRKSLFACAYKRGVAGPNEIQNGGQIQNDYIQTSCTTSQRITDITHSQSEYIPGVTDEYNAWTRANAPVCY